jgi:ABC-2 type transport system permease protein
MRLFGTELLRFWSRRLMQFGVVIVIVICAAIAIPEGLSTHPISTTEQAEAVQQYQRDLKDWERDCVDPDSEECLWDEPNIDDYLRAPTTVRDAVTTVSSFSTVLISLLCLLVGASFIAAEIHSGTLATWLIFNANRTKVYLAKLAAAGLGGAVAATLACTASLTTLAVTARVGGVSFSPIGLGEMIGWNALGGAALTTVGVGLGMITKNTVAGLLIPIAVSIVDGITSVFLLFSPQLGWIGRFFPQTELQALFGNGTVYMLASIGDSDAYTQISVSAVEGAVYWLIIGVITNGLALWIFRRREVR